MSQDHLVLVFFSFVAKLLEVGIYLLTQRICFVLEDKVSINFKENQKNRYTVESKNHHSEIVIDSRYENIDDNKVKPFSN